MRARTASRRSSPPNPKSKYVVLARQQTPQGVEPNPGAEEEGGGRTHRRARRRQPAHRPQPRGPQQASCTPTGTWPPGCWASSTPTAAAAAGLEAQLNAELAGKDGKARLRQSGGRQVPTGDLKEQAPCTGFRRGADDRPGHPVGRPERRWPSRCGASA
ncbi:hypothetical protein [Streptomyces thioluteus]|uniref:hypothetical protein n=1 Tax=Streptomyces thioluteus TaxID=66431 RepID=UPI0031ECEDC4